MGRKSVGPRKLHGGSGVYYAVFVGPDRKQYKESLKTRDHGTAMRRWGPAMERLKDRAENKPAPFIPPAPDEPAFIWDLDAEGNLVGPRETTAREIFDPEKLELSWEQAVEIHNRRIGDKRGQAITEKTRNSSQALAIKPINQIPPAQVTVRDVQRYIDGLRDQGLAASTISQRHGMLRAICKSLIKHGYDFPKGNPFDRVEATAAPGKSYATPIPEEVKLLWDTGNWHLRVLLYTGLRENELCQRQQAHLDGRWLRIDRSLGCTVKNNDSIREVLLPEWAGTQLPKPPGKTTLWRLVKKVTPRLTLHSLRSATRTALAQAGVTTEVSERILGHKVGRAVGASHVSKYATYTRDIIGPAMEAGWQVMDKWVREDRFP